LNFHDEDSFFITCRGMGDGKKENEIVENGQIRISITVVPKEM
jgi:hypothetical protein